MARNDKFSIQVPKSSKYHKVKRVVSHYKQSEDIRAKVCPNGNITVVDKKAQIGPHCTQCLACVHFCPQQAMEIRHKPTKMEIQYHHPEVKVRDLMLNTPSILSPAMKRIETE